MLSRFLLLCVMLWTAPVLAEDEFKNFVKDYNARAMKSLALYQGEAEPVVKLVSGRNPILNWSSNRNGYYGGQMFVWKRDERPLAVTGLLHWPDNKQAIMEFISLSEEPLFAELDGKMIWEGSDEKAVRWELLKNEKPPVASARVRLPQMRRIAAGFSVRAIKGPPYYETGSKWQLRLVPQPIYRYKPKGDILDGAIFSFAYETDAEALLVIEARRDSVGNAKWYYAFARACAWELQADYKKQKSVWSVERIRQYPLPQGLGFYQLARYTNYPDKPDEVFETE